MTIFVYIYILYCTLYIVHYILYIIYCTLYMVHYILYIILYYYCYYDYIVFIIIIVIIEEFTNDNLSIYMYRDICVNC